MSYFVVEDFRLGLDRRKHILTLPPGALYDLKNGNITSGGEIETCKDFVETYDLPGNTFGLQAAAGQLFVFGSVVRPVDLPVELQYQQLVHPDGINMRDLVWSSVIKGKIFAIAAYVGGAIAIFYDGVLVSDWATGAVGGSLVSNSDIASHFAAIINTDPSYSATSIGTIITITGLPGVPFTVAASAVNGGATDDQTASVGLSSAGSAVIPEVLATGTLTFTGTGAGNVSSVKVNGIEILGTIVVSPGTDNGVAAAVAAQINSFISVPDYTASVATNVVTIRPTAGTGTTPNGFVVARTTTLGGSVTPVNMAGGVDAFAGTPQISTVTIGGTFEVNDIFTIILGGTVFGGTDGTAGEQATVALAYDGKAYAIAGPNLFGSAIDDPTEWNAGTGSFVLDMSSQAAGAERLLGLGIFQNKLAVFSRTTIQIEAVDPDPALNKQMQVLDNIGTLAPKSIVPFGDVDLFFLSDTGLRSLRVRTNTDSATLSDIGSPIDPLIVAAVKAAGGNASKAVGAIEPVDGRYLLQIGTITYVFSFFPNGKVSGWSTYESGLAITDFAVSGKQLYARAVNKIYLLGGADNDQYTTKQMEIRIPFLSARQIATVKHFTGLDVACDGVFDIFMSTDPGDITAEEGVATVTKSTYGLGSVEEWGESELISLRFITKGDGKYARLANIVVHYQALEAT